MLLRVCTCKRVASARLWSSRCLRGCYRAVLQTVVRLRVRFVTLRTVRSSDAALNAKDVALERGSCIPDVCDTVKV